MINFLDLHAQYLSIKDEIDSAVTSVISDSAFIGGKYVKQFERSFSEYQNVKYCVGVGNGTDALEIAIESLNLPENSEIIVPANSFIASAEAVLRTGHNIVFCDVNSDDYTIKYRRSKKKNNFQYFCNYGSTSLWTSMRYGFTNFNGQQIQLKNY